MAKVTLIDSLGWQDGLFNLGLAYLSSSLKLAGHQVRVLDLNNKFRTPLNRSSMPSANTRPTTWVSQ